MKTIQSVHGNTLLGVSLCGIALSAALGGCSSGAGAETQGQSAGALTDTIEVAEGVMTIKATTPTKGTDVRVSMTAFVAESRSTIDVSLISVAMRAEDKARVDAFLGSLDSRFLSSVRGAVRESVADAAHPAELRSIERAVLMPIEPALPPGTLADIGDELVDCGAYAACYWGCVLGSGEWYSCGCTCADGYPKCGNPCGGGGGSGSGGN